MQFLELIIFNISTPTINVTTSSAILSPIAAGCDFKDRFVENHYPHWLLFINGNLSLIKTLIFAFVLICKNPKICLNEIL